MLRKKRRYLLRHHLYIAPTIGHANVVCHHTVLCYYAIFIHDPVPNDPNELCILSHTCLTATVETSIYDLVKYR